MRPTNHKNNGIMRLSSLVLVGLLLSMIPPVSGKLVYNNHYKQPIHTHGCYGVAAAYNWVHKMHAATLSYVAHFNPTLYTKLGVGFSNKNLLMFFNTYGINVWNRYESSYFNFLLGGQGHYKFDDFSWKKLAKNKRYNLGIELGVEFEKYLTEVVCLILSATLPISFLDPQHVFAYRLSCGLCINF